MASSTEPPPRANVSGSPLKPSVDGGAAGHKHSVLVFEAWEIVRDGIGSLLESTGEFSVLPGGSTVTEALTRVAAGEPDLVIVGPLMGNFPPDGLLVEVVSRIAEASPASRVMMLIDSDDLELVRSGINAGAGGVVPMDDPTVDLIEGARRVAEGGVFVAPRLALALVRSGRSPGQDLTEREVLVLVQVALGRTNGEIAKLLHLSVRTVESQRASLMEKLGLETRADIVRYALDHSLIS